MNVVLDEGYTGGSVYYSFNFGVPLRLSIVKTKQNKKTLSTDFPISPLYLTRPSWLWRFHFHAVGGQGGREHQRATNQPLLLVKETRMLDRGRKGRRWRALSHILSQAWHLWSDFQKDSAHNNQAHSMQ